jgi:hypothetical protein
MPVEGSIGEPYPHAIKAKRTDNGIVKFPVNVHSLLIERSQSSGYTRVIAKQNELVLSFVLDDDDCQHLAALLTAR